MRLGARNLRNLVKAHGPESVEVREELQLTLNGVYNILCTHLGTPPSEFEWQYVDADDKYHAEGPMKPLEFAEKYCLPAIDDFVSLVHDPRPTSPVHSRLIVQYLGNVLERGDSAHLNVKIDELKDIARKAIEGGECVWFGCDVGKYMFRPAGLLDTKVFEFSTAFGTEMCGMDKRERLELHDSLMTHAMVLTGVDLNSDGSVRAFRVENSWGEKSGDKGYLRLSSEWFDEYVFQIAVHKKHLSESQLSAFDKPAVQLKPWDPLGALAKNAL